MPRAHGFGRSDVEAHRGPQRRHAGTAPSTSQVTLHSFFREDVVIDARIVVSAGGPWGPKVAAPTPQRSAHAPRLCGARARSTKLELRRGPPRELVARRIAQEAERRAAESPVSAASSVVSVANVRMRTSCEKLSHARVRADGQHLEGGVRLP